MSDYTTEQLRAIDAAVAEHVMGWRWVQAPKYDYDGPLPEQGTVLVPPDLDEKTYQWPPRGIISPFAFVSGRRWSTDIAAAWEVVEKMRADKEHPYFLRLNDAAGSVGGWDCRFYRYPNATKIEYSNAPTATRAICLAALKAVGKEWKA